MKIILSSRNPSKAKQIKTSLGDIPVEVLTLEEARILGNAVEDGVTLGENALKKSHFARERVSPEHKEAWFLSDDTGLFIDALGGAPGIYAARWAGEEATTEEIRDFTLEKLRGVPPSERTAIFKTVAGLVSPDGKEHLFEGAVSGIILESPRTECLPGMPYSAIFLPHGSDKVWSEMKHSEANEISHRGKAFRQVKEFFKNLL